MLHECSSRGYRKIAFAPIGMSTSEDHEKKSEIIDCIAKTITEYLNSHTADTSPEIHFAISDVNIFQRFKQIFKNYSLKDAYYRKARKDLSDIQKKLIEDWHTHDPEFIQMLDSISYCISGERSILLLGETGVGKSTLAKMIHQNGPRKLSKFESLNCAAITPDNLMTSVFGADKDKFSQVPKDTKVFLRSPMAVPCFDEVGYSSTYFQQSLLTF
ncbi:MAG: sigma 54-interacting transcriptional regulator [Ignavibacteria bacterium]|nr:sigma 54-interacting transcriptional regulator [Ignavibacteria bacterium]